MIGEEISFGEFDTYQYSVRSKTASVVYFISYDKFLSKFRDNPFFIHFLKERISNKKLIIDQFIEKAQKIKKLSYSLRMKREI